MNSFWTTFLTAAILLIIGFSCGGSILRLIVLVAGTILLFISILIGLGLIRIELFKEVEDDEEEELGI
jgi:hypothetical protein